MSLIDDDTQEALAGTVRRLVRDHGGRRRSRETALGPDPYDHEMWEQLAGLGLAGLRIPERFGGSGAGQREVAAVFRELGAGLVPSPLLATAVLAAGTLLSLGDSAAMSSWLPRIAAGEVVALAVSEPGSRDWIGAGPATAAVPRDGCLLLNGAKRAVINGAQASALLVHVSYVGGAGSGEGICLVESGAPGLGVVAEDNIDPVRRSAAVTLADTPAVLLEGEAAAALDKVADLANLAVVAEQCGAMKAALEMTVEYANVRYSFGQPIGSYQGVKHKLAEIYTDWCLVDAALRRAIEAAEAGEPEASADAAAARVLSGSASVAAGKSAVLLHGGIGYTWEHDAHLFYKNAIGDSSVCGDVDYQERRLAEKLALATPALFSPC